MTEECDCGEPLAPGADACATCLAEEVSQGLRKATPGALGISHRGNSSDYKREYRKLKAASGRCSVCTGRPAREGISPSTGQPYRTCLACSKTVPKIKVECTERSHSRLGVCGVRFSTIDPQVRMCPKHRALRRGQEARRRARQRTLAAPAAGAYAEREED